MGAENNCHLAFGARARVSSETIVRPSEGPFGKHETEVFPPPANEISLSPLPLVPTHNAADVAFHVVRVTILGYQ